MTLTELAHEANADRALASLPRHDCADRRANNMAFVLDALAGIADDADAIADGVLPAGIGYLVADKVRRLALELEAFRARDLINQRAAS